MEKEKWEGLRMKCKRCYGSGWVVWEDDLGKLSDVMCRECDGTGHKEDYNVEPRDIRSIPEADEPS